jgi:hypothetical protein
MDFAVEPDRWSLPRRQPLRLRSQTVRPGPLKSPRTRGRLPRWLVGPSLAVLSLSAVITLTARLPATAVSDPATPVAEKALPTARIVGATPPPSSQAAAPPVQTAAADLRAPVTPDPIPVTSPPSPQVAAVKPKPELGPLPVLEVEAEAFEPLPVAEAPTPSPARTPARPLPPRVADQP